MDVREGKARLLVDDTDADAGASYSHATMGGIAGLISPWETRPGGRPRQPGGMQTRRRC